MTPTSAQAVASDHLKAQESYVEGADGREAQPPRAGEGISCSLRGSAELVSASGAGRAGGRGDGSERSLDFTHPRMWRNW